MTLDKIFHVIITTSFMGSITALLILLTKGIFKDRLSPKWHYYIWILLVLRLLLPYSPGSSISIFNIIKSPSTIVSNSSLSPSTNYSNSITAQDKNPQANSPLSDDNKLPNKDIMPTSEIESTYTNVKESAASYNHSIFNVLALIWFIITLALLIYIAVCYTTFILKVNGEPICVDKDILYILEQCKKDIKFKANLPIILSKNVKVPTVLGISKQRLLIPDKVLQFLSLEEKKYIFYHELNHLKNKDIFLSWFTTLLISLHWFNPIIWLSFKKMKKDCELSCDALTLKYLNESERKDYGKTLIKLVQFISLPVSIPGTATIISKSEIKRRIIMISKFKRASLLWSIIAVLLTFAIGCTSLTNSKNVSLSTSKNDPKDNSVQQSLSNTTADSTNVKNNNDSALTNNTSNNTTNAVEKNTSANNTSSSTSNSNTNSPSNNNNTEKDKPSNSLPDITDKQILELLNNGDISIRSLSQFYSSSYPKVVIGDFTYIQFPTEIKDSTSLNKYLNEKLSLDKYFTADFKKRLTSYIIKNDSGKYYLLVGQSGMQQNIKGGKINSKKLDGNKLYVEFNAFNLGTTDGSQVTRKAVLIYYNNRWYIDQFNNWGIPTLDF